MCSISEHTTVSILSATPTPPPLPQLAIDDSSLATIILTPSAPFSSYQLPVVFYISHHARVTPKRIVDLRLSGKSWNDISLQGGHHAGLFHVQTVENHGPPYGRALGYYKKYPKHEWSKIKLTDKEVIGLVNIKFMAARFDYDPDHVLKLHIKGESLIKLHGKIKAHKTKSKRAVPNKRGSDSTKGNAKDQKKTVPKQPSKKRGGKNRLST